MKFLYPKILGCLLFLSANYSVQAQSAANYSFTTSTTGSLTDMSSGTTQLISSSQDDFVSAITNIGFDFWFQGVRYGQFSANSNGLIRLGSTIVQTGTPYKPLGQMNMALISAYGADQRTHTTGKVHYKLIGSAPSRTLVIEWLNMQSNYNAGGTAGLTYQVRLSETSGTIEFTYGSMTMSTAGAADPNSQDPHIGFSSNNVMFVIGSVTAAQSGTPTPTYNGASNIPVANLYTAGAIPVLSSAANGSRRTFTFTPPVSAAPTGLNITAVTPIMMTLNWTDNASNEQGYVIYRSDDGGITYNFISQAAANAVSSIQTGLNPNTNYYWRIYAVTEGGLSSSALGGNQATAVAGNVSSNGTGGGLWSSPSTWSTGQIPASTDIVTIKNGDVVTIDATASAYDLNVGEGISGTLSFDATSPFGIIVENNVTIAAGGIFQSAASGTVTTHALSLSGNLVNNGTLDFSTNSNTAGASITFAGAANKSFSGTGGITNIRTLVINKGNSNTSVLELNPTNFTVQGSNVDGPAMAFLTLTNGTFKISGSFTMAARVFDAAAYTIPVTGGFWLNNPNFTVSGQNGNAINNGLLRISQGIYNEGTVANNTLTFGTGVSYIMEGGTANIAGRFISTNMTYTQTSGAMNICTVGNSTANSASFSLSAGFFNMSGGSITIVQINSNATATNRRDYYNLITPNITGGVLNLGTGSTTGNAGVFDYRVYGYTPSIVIDNTTNNKTLTAGVNGASAGTAVLVGYGDLIINPGTTFFAGGFFSSIAGNLVNNGTLNSNTVSSRFSFSGTTPQTYSGSGIAGTNAAPMLSFEINNTAGVTIHPAVANNVVTNRVIFFYGGLTNSNKLTLGSGGASIGTVQYGNTTTPYNAGNFDVAPVFNLGTGGQSIYYLRVINPRTTGVEINPSRQLNTFYVDDNVNTLTVAGGNLSASTYTQVNGNVNIGTNTLTLGSSSSPGTFTYTSGTIIGKFKRWLVGTTGNRDFPVGTATAKRNVSINFTTAPLQGSLTAEWIPASGGNNGLPLTEGAININTTSAAGYWRVTAGDGLSGGNYTGSFTATGIGGVNDYTQLVLLKRADASSPWTLDGTHVTTTGSNAIPLLSRTGMANFSEFGIGGDFPVNPLPVTLISFTAQRSGRVNLIGWSTSQEINTSHFILERSTDGRNFAAITQVTAAGNSNSSRSYAYTDMHPASGINYYRLRMVDRDNSNKYSLVRSVRNEGIADIAVYPNPVQRVLTVSISADKTGQGNMMITDMGGKIIYQKPISVVQGNNMLPVDISNIAGGSYLIKVQLSDDIVVKQFNKL
jgi:hypothetical protein